MARGVFLEIRHKGDCPGRGDPRNARRCRCAPTVRARVKGQWLVKRTLNTGWLLRDLEPIESEALRLKDLSEQGVSIERKQIPTMGEWALRYIAQVRGFVAEGTYSPQTLSAYEGTWNVCVKRMPQLERLKITAVTAERILELRTLLLERDYSVRTVSNMLYFISGVLTDAVHAGLIPFNPAQAARSRRRHGSTLQIETGRAERVMEMELVQMLLSTTDGALREMILLDLTTGARKGELRALRWEDVDFGRNRLHIRNQLLVKGTGEADLRAPKYASQRQVLLYSEVAASLGRRRCAEGWVFEDWHGGPYTCSAMQKSLTAAWDAIATRPRGHSWHILRHTFQTMLERGRVRPETIARLMGHKRQGVSGVYSHVEDRELDEVEAVLAAALSPATLQLPSPDNVIAE